MGQRNIKISIIVLVVEMLILIVMSIISIDKGRISIVDAFSPKQGSTDLVVHEIKGAEKSIRIAAYSFTSVPIIQALIDVHNRGVDVQIVLDRGQLKGKAIPVLVEHHIPVRINSCYAIMHNKFMIFDNKSVELGSFNFTSAAENRNAENVLVINGSRKLSGQYLSQWTRLWEEAHVPQDAAAKRKKDITCHPDR